jgi:hypothetical protein
LDMTARVVLSGQIRLPSHRTRYYRGSYTAVRKEIVDKEFEVYQSAGTANNRYHYLCSSNSSTNNCDANVVVAKADGNCRPRRRRFEKLTVPIRLDTALRKVKQMSNKINSDLAKDFYQRMKENGTSQNYHKGNSKSTSENLS